MAGTLYICATPIGNLSDVTLRVLDVLGRADIVAAEDTRRTRKLLSHYDLSSSLMSYREHNREQAGKRILGFLGDGRDVALVSDSGMPAISDPGQNLVEMVIESGFSVQVVPGPNAALTALVLSGLSTARFAFEGFLPRKGQERTQRLKQIERESRTMIIYESPQRVTKTLDDLCERLGADRKCSLSRELTKRFEETIRGTISSVLNSLKARELRGECVLVVEGSENPESHEDLAHSREMSQELKAMARAYAAELVSGGSTRRDAAHRISAAIGRPWRSVYRLITTTPRPSAD